MNNVEVKSTEAAARADDAPDESAAVVYVETDPDVLSASIYMSRQPPPTPCPDCDGHGTVIHPPGDAWDSSSLDWCGQCDGVGHVSAWDEA